MITNEAPDATRNSPVPSRRLNSFAVAALVTGILAITSFFPLAFVAIILGHRARGEIREARDRRGYHEEGHAIATAGLIIGYVFAAWFLVSLFLPPVWLSF